MERKGHHSAQQHHDPTSLPLEVLTAILAHVDLKARLRSCALVCRTWAAAAAAATTTLDMQLRDQAHADSLSKWLGTHGCNIEHLAVCFDEQYHAPQESNASRLQLPLHKLPALKSLEVHTLRVAWDWACADNEASAKDTAAVLPAATAARGSVAGGSTAAPNITPSSSSSSSSSSSPTEQPCLPSLVRLQADDWSLCNGLASALLCQPHTLASLQSLCITQVPCLRLSSAVPHSDYIAAIQPLFAACGRVRELLMDMLWPAVVLLHVPQLPQLQRVKLQVTNGGWGYAPNMQAWLQHLPDCLVQLELSPLWHTGFERCTLDLSRRSIGRLQSLRQLRHLALSDGSYLDPCVLAPLTGLTHLHLEAVHLGLKRQQQQQQRASGLLGSAAILDVLAGLTNLQELRLCPDVLPLPYAPLEQYSALTASSTLTLLNLYHCQLPAGAVAHMFPAGRCLPRLQRLRLSQLPNGRPLLGPEQAYAAMAGPSTNGSGPEAPFGPGSLDALVACCPNLGQLWLTAAVAADADLAPLRRLSGLTELQLGGAVVDDAAAEAVLCGLQQLQRLDLVGCPRFTDAGLVWLTALTALTSLQVKECALSPITSGAGQVLYLCRQQEGFQAGLPLCERLLQRCSSSTWCLTTMLRQRNKQLQETQAALQASEVRAAAAEMRAAAAEARLAEVLQAGAASL